MQQWFFLLYAPHVVFTEKVSPCWYFCFAACTVRICGDAKVAHLQCKIPNQWGVFTLCRSRLISLLKPFPKIAVGAKSLGAAGPVIYEEVSTSAYNSPRQFRLQTVLHIATAHELYWSIHFAFKTGWQNYSVMAADWDWNVGCCSGWAPYINDWCGSIMDEDGFWMLLYTIQVKG